MAKFGVLYPLASNHDLLDGDYTALLVEPDENGHPVLRVVDDFMLNINNTINYFCILNKKEMSQLQLNTRAGLRDSSFIGVFGRQMLAEMGGLLMNGEIYQHEKAAMLIYQTVQNVLSLSSQVFNIAKLRQYTSLPMLLRNEVRGMVSEVSNAQMKSALDNTNQTKIIPANIKPASDNEIRVMYHPHRQEYVSELFKKKVPAVDAEWHVENIISHQSIIERSKLEPMIIKVEVKKFNNNKLSYLFGFGTTARHRSEQRILREWVTAPEYFALVRLADVKIKGAFVGSHYQPNPYELYQSKNNNYNIQSGDGRGHIEIGSLKFVGDSMMSYAGGVLSEAMLKSLTLCYKSEYDPITSWVQAYDRLQMLQHAIDVTRLDLPGVNLKSYGSGVLSVGIDISHGDVQYTRDVAAEIAMNTNLIGPTLLPKPDPKSARWRMIENQLKTLGPPVTPSKIWQMATISGNEKIIQGLI